MDTHLPNGAWVSTVFLGINHRWGSGPPLLFETMVFWETGRGPELQVRWSTWLEAEEGHQAIAREAMRPRYWFTSIMETLKAVLQEARWQLQDIWRDLTNAEISEEQALFRRLRERQWNGV